MFLNTKKAKYCQKEERRVKQSSSQIAQCFTYLGYVLLSETMVSYLKQKKVLGA